MVATVPVAREWIANSVEPYPNGAVAFGMNEIVLGVRASTSMTEVPREGRKIMGQTANPVLPIHDDGLILDHIERDRAGSARGRDGQGDRVRPPRAPHVVVVDGR